MKRKRSTASSQTGCQVIAKFFKASEKKDIHDVPQLNKFTPKKVSPELRELSDVTPLTKRKGETWEGKASYKNNVIMNDDNAFDKENYCEISLKNVSQSNYPEAFNVQSNCPCGLRADNNKSKTNSPSLNTKENGTNTCIVTNQTTSTGVPLLEEIMADDSEQSLIDQNTEENLADDEDESEKMEELVSEDDESPIKRNLFKVTDKLSKTSSDNLDCILNTCNVNPTELLVPEKTDQCFASSDSDSDNDLLTPPMFLYDSKVKIDQLVCTPEKLTVPVGASPLRSPIKPSIVMQEETKEKQYKFSLQKMLNKSKKTEAKDAQLSNMQADLHADIKKGGVKSMTSAISEDDTDTDDGKDLSKCKLPSEVAKHLVKVTNFSEKLIGEDIFPDFYSIKLEKKLPPLTIPNTDQNDRFIENLSRLNLTNIQEDICGGWLLQYYLKRPCPASLAEWIFKVMCLYPDIYLSKHCFKALWGLMRAGYQEQNTIPKGIRGIFNWIPTTTSIINILYSYGANKTTLSLDETLSNIDKKDEKTPLTIGASFQVCDLCFHVRQLVQIVTHSVHYGPYMENDLPILLGLVCRLSLDVRLQELLFDFETCISEILNCFGNSQWELQIQCLPEIIVKTTSHHRNLLHIMKVLPTTPRGLKLRQLTCLVLLKILVTELLSSGNGSVKTETRTEELEKLCKKTSQFEVNELSIIVDEIKPKALPYCDNYILHTIIFLVDLAVGPEEYPPSERVKLKMLTNKLNNLNGEIEDPRAKFLDRTKVKDLIVRTIHRIQCLMGTIKTAKEKSVSSYFETTCSTSYTISTLEETAVSPVRSGSSNSSSREPRRGPSPVWSEDGNEVP